MKTITIVTLLVSICNLILLINVEQKLHDLSVIVEWIGRVIYQDDNHEMSIEEAEEFKRIENDR